MKRPNHSLQRFDGFGKPGEGFPGGKGLVNNQTESAGADEPTVPRRERRGGPRCVPRAGSLSLGR